MTVTWTQRQRQAIELRNRSLLVSAAAGSGKTAVLVERIVRRITEGEKPVDADRLLVVTFTNAAAAQIRERVQRAIDERLEADPQNRLLKRQQTLIRQAKITTIDSFCLSVLREQFHRIDLDPSFRVGDEGELRLLREDVLGELIERRIAQADPEFLDFWDAYNPGRDDTKGASLILDLYEFAMASPRPKTWLRDCCREYDTSSFEELERTAWMKGLCERTVRTLKELTQILQSTLEGFIEQGDMEAFEAVVRDELRQLERSCAAQGYRELRAALGGISFGRKPRRKKTDTWDEDKAEKLWQSRVRVKEETESIFKESFVQDPEEVLLHHQLAGRQAKTLAELTAEFIDLYGAAKRRRNLVDFHDLEHLALDVLSEETTAGEVPTAAAEEYAARFEEIMIDEYQDSNYVQELILSSISRERRGEPNCFMVGDVKQSIYRFRLARPELFMEKYETYTEEESRHQKLELHQNFRSRAEVLEGVNYFFYQLMHKSLGNVEYTKEAALHPGLEYEETTLNAGGPIRLLLLDTEYAVPIPEEDGTGADGKERAGEEQTGKEHFGSENENGTDEAQGSVRRNIREWEAVMVADEILKLTDPKDGKQVWDADEGCYRPARYGDITILLRTMSGWAQDFAAVLMSRGIPVVSETGTGYFSALEVQNVINLLRIIDNPRQDIPLAGVLRSPIGGFSDEELARIKLGTGANEDGLYGMLQNYMQQNASDGIARRLRLFSERLADYRERSGYLPLHELVSYVMKESGYYEYVCAMPGSARRRENLDMLAEKAAQFEASSYRGVFWFVRYLEKLQTYSIDYPEASEGTAANAVHIMSIHKSKGLEFPIVIAAGLGKAFNVQDARQPVILHPDYGIGADAIDIETRTAAPALMKKVLAKEITLDNLGEELRVLYVAMTRAKELLILSGAKQSMLEWLGEKLPGPDCQSELLSYLSLTSARSYLDWIVPAMAKHRCFDDVYRRLNLGAPYDGPLYSADVQLEVKLITTGELETAETAKRLDAAWYRRQLEAIAKEKGDPAQEELIRERLEFDYCRSDMYRIAASMSVSEIKKRFQEENPEEISLFPGGAGLPAGNDCLPSGDAGESGDAGTADPAAGEETHTLPAFMSGEARLSGAQRGTLYHWLFQHYDPCSPAGFEEQVQGFVERGVLDPEEFEQINAEDFCAFYQTDLGKRCIRARREGTYHAESPFCLGIPAADLNPKERVWEEAYVKVHGIIDAWFEQDGKLVLIDYKTDRIYGRDWADRLRKRYRVQLEYYRMALERMTGRTVDEVYLYSVREKKAIEAG